MNRYLSYICASFLLSASCNDCDNKVKNSTDKVKNSTEVSWSPPKPSEGYGSTLYRQPANVGAYDVERRYIEENCYVPDKFRDLGPDIALDPFGNPIHEFNRILISNPGPDWNRAIRDRKSIIEKGGPFSSMGFPEPHDTEQKDNWVKQSTHGIPECGIAVNSDRGYIKSPGKGHIEVSGEWSSGASLNSKPAEGALGLYINDEKTPRASFSTNTAEVIARYTPSRALYRFYAKNIEINKGDKIYFKETKLAVSTIQNCVIYLKPEGNRPIPPSSSAVH